jgi:membrane-bound inhibitor of C-type lysozyme
MPSKPPLEFHCEDGKGFAISFVKDGAILIFHDQSGTKILTNDHVASGIEYSNDGYVFRQYQGKTALTELTQSKENTTTCNKVGQK